MDEKHLNEFIVTDAAKEEAIEGAEAALGWSLPSDYKRFLRKSNGGEGFIGESYLVLWPAEDLAKFNIDIGVNDYAPGLVLFGSTGGGEAFAFDTRTSPPAVVMVPLIGMELRYARWMAPTFDDFISRLAVT